MLPTLIKLINKDTLHTYRHLVYRVALHQEQEATWSLVNSPEEQNQLEAILEIIKPPVPTSEKHYLIVSPFRYPPLVYGSRFGAPDIPSYFYASESAKTALSEAAHYRFALLDDTEPYDQPIKSRHVLFSVDVTSDACLDLTKTVYTDYQKRLRHPNDYSLTQAIGKQALANGTDVLRFCSARHYEGINAAIADIAAIVSVEPNTSEEYFCVTTQQTVSYSPVHSRADYSFTREQLVV